MRRIILCLIILILGMGIGGCVKVEERLPQEIQPHQEELALDKEELALDKIEEPGFTNISEKIQEYIKNMSPKEKIGQLLMPAFRDSQYTDSVEIITESMEEVLEVYQVGGIILFKENIKNKDQVQDLIQGLQKKSRLPLWIGVDEEGGMVSRIASNPEMGFDPVPSAFDIGQAGNKEEAYEVGKRLGSMLKELGFNMDFAPVADIWSNPKNTVIGKRSFGTNPETVSVMVNEVTRGIQDQDIISVIKHFPGHGDTAEDSHVGRAFVDRSLEELRQRELIPFQSAIDKEVEGIMVAHVELPQIDEGVPATLSHTIITDILKNQMQFKGLIITDALDMQAITSQFGKGEAALQSFLAGTDILLMPDVEEAYNHLLKAYQDGVITDERLEESVYKILYTKYKYEIINQDFFN
ncbi:MAG TPA: beta-N-acetylhexosaminidase [Epulopiscium sp.]|nr:beta-N-acetylhexosaminidase [Candidatus Epulonipiscium sp.]